MDNKTTGAKKLLLKPASFKSNGNSLENGSENGNTTSPAVNNPFLRCEKDEPEAAKPDEKSNEDEKEPAKDSTNNLFKSTKTNLFVNAATSAMSDNSNFVFGQNLHERVVMENVSATSEDSNKKGEDSQLFSSVTTPSTSPPEKDSSNEENPEAEGDIQKVPDIEQDPEKKDSTNTISTDNNLSLVEAARKYEEMRGAQKRKFDEVEITTGEEDERNILEINCKLFTFIENNYEERGRGILRLNDSKTANSQSRVVFRASGSLRLLLNTKVWRDQKCEQPSQKSLRLTAFDTNGVIKIYLVMGRVEDMRDLFRALGSRIRKEKNRTVEPEPEACPEATEVVKDKKEIDGPALKRPATCE